MLPYRDSRLTQIALAVFFVAILAYAYYEARGMIYGPRITVPTEIQEVHEPFIRVKGTAERISSLSMNGKPIAVTEDGKFDEPYLVSPGMNRILLDAKDKYGRTRQSEITILYTPTATPPAPVQPVATSTATTTTP